MKLSKDDLKNLYHLDKEIDDIDRQIFELNQKIYASKNLVSDTVKDYWDGRGRIIKISGYNRKRYAERMTSLVGKLDEMKIKYLDQRIFIEDRLDEIEDAEIRRIIRLKYMDRLAWDGVAVRIGPYATADAVRIKLERFLEN